MGDNLVATQELNIENYSDITDDRLQYNMPWGLLYPIYNNNAGISLKSFCFFDNVITLGRGSHCNVTIEITTVSNEHCHFFRKQLDGNSTGYIVCLEDLSKNGTYINDKLAGHRIIRPVKDGDRIGFPMYVKRGENTVSSCNLFIFVDLMRENCYEGRVTDEFLVSNYRLGIGAFAEVRLSYECQTGNLCAAKCILKSRLDVNPVEQGNLIMEASILLSINHPCIIKVLGVFDTDMTLFIMLELAEHGALIEHILARKRLSERDCKFFFYQMVLALSYLHSHDIVHRDLKLENVLLFKRSDFYVVKLSDFGLAKIVGENNFLKTMCGTPTYLAPEIVLGDGKRHYTAAVDLWSLGVILFVCLSGYPPFSDEIKTNPLYQQIVNGTYAFVKPYWDHISPQATEVVKALLKTDPRMRATCYYLLHQSEWLQDNEMRTIVHIGLGLDLNSMGSGSADASRTEMSLAGCGTTDMLNFVQEKKLNTQKALQKKMHEKFLELQKEREKEIP